METKPVLQTENLYRAIQLTRPLLRRISAYVEQELTDTGVSVGQRAVLEVLYNQGPLTAPQLTRMLELKRQFVARMLSEASDAGLVEQLPNPDHARAHMHVLTDAGRAAIETIRDHEMTRLSELEKQFSADEIEAHFKVQQKLISWFSQNLKS